MLTNAQLRKLNIDDLFVGIIADSTLYTYRIVWRAFLTFCGRERTLDGDTVLAWRGHMIGVDKLAQGTINARINTVKAVARELYARRKIDRNTYYDIKEVRVLPSSTLRERRRPHNQVRIEPEQMRALCTAPQVAADNPLALRDRAMMLTLATTGARLSEVLNMQVRDIVAHSSGEFLVTNVMGKHQSQARSVPLSKEAHEAILDWIEFRPVHSPYIFTGADYSKEGDILYNDKPLKRQTALYRIKRVAAELGLEHIKAHDFRRFVGTQLAQKDLRQAQKVLGHSTPSITAKHYVLDDVQVGITSNLFAAAPVALLLHMLPGFATDDTTNGYLAHVVEAAYLFLAHLVNGM